MLHVWCIYLQLGDFVRAHVGVHIPAPWVAYGLVEVKTCQNKPVASFMALILDPNWSVA